MEDFPPFTKDQLVSLTDPALQMNAWLAEANKTLNIRIFTICLSTSTADGRSSNRMVNMVSFSEEGLRFFTCKSGVKAQEIKENPNTSVVFYWEAMGRQVRLEGHVQALPQEVMEPYYYHDLTREQMLTTLLGNQDKPVSSRDEMLQMKEQLRAKYPDDTPLPFPHDWSGYLLVPNKYIFYQGHSDWLSDRFEYTLQSNRTWSLQRLMP